MPTPKGRASSLQRRSREREAASSKETVFVTSRDEPPKLAGAAFTSRPEPPPLLWDTDDLEYLDKVKCEALVRLIHMEPKDGCFKVKMKCNWSFRTLNMNDKTETILRVPGIRMPGLIVEVEESRIWRNMRISSESTVYWEGTSIFNLQGYEIFEMEDFPFDRQLINLELFEFVWRPDKDAATYDFAMKVVDFRVETCSFLPEWVCYPALVSPEKVHDPASGPGFASRFQIQLRVERQSWFYVVQIFLVTYLITTVSCFPLAMPPSEQHVGDRLSLYGTGMLTLVAFKYGVADHLPSVPYSTFTDHFMLVQVCCLVFLSVETLIMYRVVTSDNEEVIDVVENLVLVFLVLCWMAWFLHVAFFKRRKTWRYLANNQQVNVERL